MSYIQLHQNICYYNIVVNTLLYISNTNCEMTTAADDDYAQIFTAITNDNVEFFRNRTDIREIASREDYCRTVLFYNRNAELVEFFLENGASTEIEADHHLLKYTALMNRLIHDYSGVNDPIVKLLIRYKADVNYHADVSDSFLSTPLQCAVSRGNLPMTQLLIDEGAIVEDKTLFVSPMSPECLKLLLDNNGNVDAADCRGVTILGYYVKQLYLQRVNGSVSELSRSGELVMRLLLDRGADPKSIFKDPRAKDMLDNYQRPPFHPLMLRKLEVKEICTLLLIRKIDIDCRHCLGVLPLELIQYIAIELVGMM